MGFLSLLHPHSTTPTCRTNNYPQTESIRPYDELTIRVYTFVYSSLQMTGMGQVDLQCATCLVSACIMRNLRRDI